MTFEQASQIYYINKEIKAIQKEIADLEGSRIYLKAVTYSDMPKGSSSGDGMEQLNKYLDERRTLEEMLNYNLSSLQHERLEMERFLQTIEDAEMRLIVRLRCINNMSWREIGDELNMSHTTAMRKFYEFWNKQEKGGG